MGFPVLEVSIHSFLALLLWAFSGTRHHSSKKNCLSHGSQKGEGTMKGKGGMEGRRKTDTKTHTRQTERQREITSKLRSEL